MDQGLIQASFGRVLRADDDGLEKLFLYGENSATAYIVEAEEHFDELMSAPSRVQIRNLALVICIVTKNEEGLRLIIHQYASIFLNLDNDLPAAIHFCIKKQWAAGVNLLLPQLDLVFSHMPLLDRFSFLLSIM